MEFPMIKNIFFILTTILSANAMAADFKVEFSPPPGTMTQFLGDTAPAGYLLATGQPLSKVDYAALYAVENCKYGCPDADHFKLPDMRGIFAKGAGTSEALTNAVGAPFSGVLGHYENDSFQGHAHNNLNGTGGPNTGGQPYGGGLGGATGNANVDAGNGSPRLGNETKPANLSVNYIIKY